MKSHNKSLIGSIVAFVLGTSCCWLTSLAVWLGGATALTAFATFTEKHNTLIMISGVLLFALGILQLWMHKKQK